MPTTLEDVNIVMGALTSCKTKEEIMRNVNLPADVVNEVLEHLRKLNKISKDDFTDRFCPISQIAGEISRNCNGICEAMKE